MEELLENLKAELNRKAIYRIKDDFNAWTEKRIPTLADMEIISFDKLIEKLIEACKNERRD